MKAVIFIIMSTSLFIFNDVDSQERYSTSDGLIVFSATINDRTVNFVSNELQVNLNYETAEIAFKIDKADLRSESEFSLQLFKPEMLRFNGKLGLDYIRTESHPVQNFMVEGTLKSSSGDPYYIHGSGTLTHLYHKNGISCLLNLSFHLVQDDVAGLLLSSPPPGAIHIEIIQTLLDTHND